MAFPRRGCSPPAGLLAPGEATVADVSARLGVSRSTVIAWIDEGLLCARRDATDRYLVVFTPDVEASCRVRIANSPWIRRADTTPATTVDATPAQVAQRLGISRDAVYNWVRRGYLPARVGPGGRTYVSFTPEVEAECRRRIAGSPQLPASTKAKALQHASGDAL